MKHCRTSVLGLIRVMQHAVKNPDMESTSSAVIPGISGVCWTRMVVSLGGRKLKP